ncbi:MAG: glycerophosphodiester phosphodiesterase [Lachnospiraceae bacterium]|nr:glycerophosphodiester phosphodiesterase [Lachnospiraceae bacterium]
MNVIVTVLTVFAVLLILYLYLVMPRVINRPDTSVFDGRLFAHRGLHDNLSDAPENSMKAFRLAVENGFGIELDVQLSKDGIPAVIHDFNLKRACGIDRRVDECTFDELSAIKLFGSEETVPAFKDVLDLVNGKVPLIIEVKSESTDTSVCSIIWEILKDYKGKYCVESFNPLAIRWFRKNEPQVMRGQLSDGFIYMKELRAFPKVFFYGALQFLLSHHLSRPDFVAYNWHYEANPSRRLVRKLFRLPCAAWTIKSSGELEAMKDRFDVFIFDSFVPDKESAGQFINKA